jgi:biotin carboxylase
MSRPLLVLLESNTSGTGRLFARTARELDCQPILLTTCPTRYPYAQEDGLETRVVPDHAFRTLYGTVKRLAREAALRGVFSSSEYFITATAELAAALGLSGPDPAATRACRDKAVQRLTLARGTHLNPRFAWLRTASQLEEAQHCFEFPVVLKPVCGTGSRGVRLAKDASELLDAGRQLLSTAVNERGMPIPPEILVEEYLEGPEYSVEVFDGEVVGITRKHLSLQPFFVETGHDYPAPLSAGEKLSIEACAREAAALLGLCWGPIHIELRLTRDRRPVIVEVNPRLAGGFIPSLVSIATGIELIRNTLLRAMGNQADLTPVRAQAASIRFIVIQASGILSSIGGLLEAAAMPGICEAARYVPDGAQVTVHHDFRDRIGHVIAAGLDTGAASKSASAAIGLIKPEILPTP